VPYNDADIARPAFWRNPADALRYIYRTYAAKHPIMIGEFAASHATVVDERSYADFAVNKIGQLYSALPRLYPRIKAVHWLSMNTIKYADPARRLNNYTLLGDDSVADQYRQQIASPYFLEQVRADIPSLAPQETMRLTDGTTLSGTVGLTAWVKSYEQRPTVTLYVNGSKRESFLLPGTYEWTLDTRSLANGPVRISVEVKDSSGRIAGRQSLRARIQNL